MDQPDSFSIMHPTGVHDFSTYNSKILLYQDEAFNLACYLVNDETQAAKVVGSVFKASFDDFNKSQQDFRLYMVRRVIESCQKQVKLILGPETIRPYLKTLSEEQKIVLILVDCLDLTYQDVANIMEKPFLDIRKILAVARSNFLEMMRISA